MRNREKEIERERMHDDDDNDDVSEMVEVFVWALINALQSISKFNISFAKTPSDQITSNLPNSDALIDINLERNKLTTTLSKQLN